MHQTLSSNESVPSEKKKIIVLGSGPNRIGQGIEFDYCCVHGLLAIKESGYDAIMVNCNPETVSTDFDIAAKLYFEPVYWEHLWEIIELEQPYGVIVQLGGQTALKLARKLHKKGVRIIGTSFDNMDIAEDRGRFSDLLKELEIPYPEYGTAMFVSLTGMFLPTVMLSGFMFPIKNMPLPLQMFSNVVPAKWFYNIVKSVMIKGLGLGSLLKETGILIGMTVILLMLSIKKFKIRLA